MSWLDCLLYVLLVFCVFPFWLYIVAKAAAYGWNNGVYQSNRWITKEILKNGKKNEKE